MNIEPKQIAGFSSQKYASAREEELVETCSQYLHEKSVLGSLRRDSSTSGWQEILKRDTHAAVMEKHRLLGLVKPDNLVKSNHVTLFNVGMTCFGLAAANTIGSFIGGHSSIDPRGLALVGTCAMGAHYLRALDGYVNRYIQAGIRQEKMEDKFESDLYRLTRNAVSST